MNLYLLSQDVNDQYDTYDSAVVCAASFDEAKDIHPDGGLLSSPKPACGYNYSLYSWVEKSKVHVQLIGKAVEGLKKGVICASYNPE